MKEAVFSACGDKSPGPDAYPNGLLLTFLGSLKGGYHGF